MFVTKYNLNYFLNMKNIIFIVLLIVINNTMFLVQAEEIPADFDHDDTNFLLSGAHLKVECKVCHVRDVYQGIPLSCEACHSKSSLIATTKKSNEHFESVDTCDNCHTAETWKGARIDHDSVTGICSDCHNSIVATGKTPDHIQSTDECNECHTTRRWKQSGFDHNVITGNCFSCHNGTTAKGKSKKHRMSNNQCNDCHHVKSWKSKSYDHKGIKSDCLSCHKDVLPALPHPQNDRCEKCHTPSKKWQQVRFNHELTNDLCVSCHENSSKPANHFIINTDLKDRCDDCHRAVSNWISNIRYTHEVADYQEHRTNTPCLSCHVSNTSTVLWRLAVHKPHCVACHANSYRRPSHPKSPTIDYTLNELADCTTSCHTYTSATFTTRLKTNNANYHSALRGRGITAPR